MAELKSVFTPAVGGVFLEEGADFAVAETPATLSGADLSRLGGVIKLFLVTGECKPSELSPLMADFLAEASGGRSIDFGVSFLGRGGPALLRRFLKVLKEALKGRGVSSRFANKDFANLSSAQSKGLLASKGVELAAAFGRSTVWAGRLVAVQDIDAYSRRDYEKPFRDMKVGMLPPKLAQILINLTGVPAGTLWDPFCGGGVLLMEGTLMGYRMLGSDIDERVLEGARQNCRWLAGALLPSGSSGFAEIFRHDAREPLLGRPFNAVVTEAYLGKPHSFPFTPGEAEARFFELTPLFRTFFESLAKSGFRGPVVIALPALRLKTGGIALPEAAVRAAEAAGFKKRAAFRQPLLYARPDQVVGRAIYCFAI